MLLLTTLLALAPPAPRGPERDIGDPPSTDPALEPDTDVPTAPPVATPATPLDTDIERGLPQDYEPPFPSDPMLLSDVLKVALTKNVDLRSNAVDVDISEANVLAAQGVFDLIFIAGVSGSIAKTPQRGSQFTITTGARQLGVYAGFNRKFATGGTLTLRLDVSRATQDQATNFLNANAGSTQLSTYRIAPTLTLTQPLLKGAGIKVNRADINKAKLAVNAAQAAQIVTAQNLVRDLISSYWDVLFAHRDLQNKRNSVELARKQLDRTNALVAAGRLSPVDAKAVEQALAARESDVLTAEYNLLDKSLTLRTQMGEEFTGKSDSYGVVPTTDPVVQPQPVNITDEIDRALAQNPQIRQLEIQIASGRIDEMVAANKRLPQLDATATFTPQGRSIDKAANSQTGDPGGEGNWGEAFKNFFNVPYSRDKGLLADWTLSGGLSLTWDVMNRTAKGQHAAAKAQIRKAQVNLDRAKQQVVAGVVRAANSLRTTGKVMDVAQISVDLAKENLKAEQARFEVGRSTNFDVLLRLDELDKAQAAALSAQVNYLKARAQLQALSSEILPAYGLDTP